MANNFSAIDAILERSRLKRERQVETITRYLPQKKPVYVSQKSSDKKVNASESTIKPKQNEKEQSNKTAQNSANKTDVKPKQNGKNQSDKTAQESVDKTEENFVWDKSYAKTAKENAVKKTKSGVSFYDRYNQYFEDLDKFSKSCKKYFKNSYDENGDLLRKNVSDLRQEAIEISKQLEKNKDEIIAANGIDKYNQVKASLDNTSKFLKSRGKAIISQRDVVNSFKNDENYKDDNARKAAYDDFCYDRKLYYKYGDLDYKKRNSEIERLNIKKNKYKENGLDTTKIDRKINWLEGYSQNYGYRNDNYYKEQMAGYDKDLDDLDQKIQIPDKNDKEFKKYAKEQYEKTYDFHGSDSDFDMIWDSFDKNDSVVVEFWQKFNSKKIKEIQGKKAVLEKLRNNFEDYKEIISKYDDVTNNKEYQKTSDKISNKTKNSFIKDYNTNEVYKHMGKGDIDEIDEDDLDILNENEVKILNFYLNQNQKEKAFKFIKDIRNSYDYGAREQQQLYNDIKDSSWLAQIGYTVLSVPASVIGSVTSAIGDFTNKITGQKLNPYDDMHALSNYAETARSAVSDTIAENAGSAFSWLYNSGLGIADFFSELLITKNVGKVVGLGAKGTSRLMQGIVSTGAYSSTAMQAKKDGCDDATAITLGLLSGAIEWATEKYSIEALLKVKPGDKVWTSIYKNALTEGSEEGASTVANFFVDLAIQGETSEHKENISNYIKYGYTESEAKQKAYLDLGKQVVSDVAAGALMGSTLGGGTSIAANITKKTILNGEYAKSYGQAIIITNADQEIIANAKKFGVDTSKAEQALKTLEDVENRLEADKKNQALRNEYQAQFEKTANTFSELEYNIEQNGGKTEINGDKLKLALNGSDYLSNSSTVNDADIEETSRLVEKDLRDRGINNQERIEKYFREKETAKEISKIHGGKIEVEGVIRTDKVSRRIEAFNDSKGYETVWFKNARIKGKDGKISATMVNGFTDGNKIYLNADVPLDRQIFKHEYHHMLEKAQGFEKYTKRVENSAAFKDWISTKAEALGVEEDYKEQYNTVINEYIRKQKSVTDLTNTKAKNEAFADFMAEELFGGKDFDKTMGELEKAFEDKGAFQKFIDVIKDILSRIKEALGGSTSTEALERNIVKLQKQIDSKRVKNNTTKNGSVKYKIKEDSNGRYVEINANQDLFEGRSIKEMQSTARKVILNKFKNKVLQVGDDSNAYINKRSAEEYAFPANRRMEKGIKEAKLCASTELDNLLLVSEFLDHKNDDGRHPDAIGGWDDYLTIFKVNNIFFEGNVKIKITKNGRVFYDITKIRKITRNGGLTENNSVAASGNLSNNNISQNEKVVNNSISENSKNDNKFSVDDTKQSERDNDKDIRFSVDDEVVDRYTNKQYNNFGWIVTNEVLTEKEWSQYSNKLNETLTGKGTKNAKGERVITVGESSSDITALVYVKGTISNPIVTKVVRINSSIKENYNINTILEELNEYERQGYREPSKVVENDYGQEIFLQVERKDFGTLSEIKQRRKREFGTEINSDSEKIGNRAGSDETNRTDSEAGLNNNSAFSIDENNKFTVSKDLNTSENSVENDDKNGIIKNNKVDNGIKIERRHTGKGNPNAILTFGTELNKRQDKLSKRLTEYGNYITVNKKEANMTDLASLTAVEGVEFAMFTKGNKRIIIRGNKNGVFINQEMAKFLVKDGYRWSGHTHPGLDFNCLMPSEADKKVLFTLGQETSVIYNSKGQFVTFKKE